MIAREVCNMQPLSQSARGTYTIKWMFGIPEVLEQMKLYQISEGSTIQVIQKLHDSLIIRCGDRRFASGNEVAERIQV